jgi:hypothetical protein
VDGRPACDLVDDSATIAANLGVARGTARREPRGSACEFTSRLGTTARVSLAHDVVGGLGELAPAVADAEVSQRRLAGLPARLEDAGDDCGLATELVPGTVMHVRYAFDERVGGGLACKFAEVMAAAVLVELLNQTGG